MSLFRPGYIDKNTGRQKRSAVWWYEFIYAGKRVRESAKTTRKTVSAEAEKRRRLELERALAGMPAEKPESRIRSVSEALKAYQKAYAVNHDRPKSVQVVEERSVHLDRLLGSLLALDILEPSRILRYMESRRGEGASNRTINMELAVLSRAFGRKWSAMWPSVKKLEERSDVGRAVEADEERAVMEAAHRNPSPLAYPFLTTLRWTGMRPDKEARLLRWEQMDFEREEVVVAKSKTAAGSGRVIPMSQELRWALEQHRARYESWFGPIQPGWFVFPFLNSRRPTDPSRPMTSLKKARGHDSPPDGGELSAVRLRTPLVLHQTGGDGSPGKCDAEPDGSCQPEDAGALFPYPDAGAAERHPGGGGAFRLGSPKFPPKSSFCGKPG
jgi:integrase